MSSAQKVPAWKRLGLKLKQPASGAEIGGPAPAEGSKPNGQQHHDRHASGPVVNAANASPAAAAAAKRKRLDQQTPPAFSSPFKRTRTDDLSSNATPTLRRQKSVTFADDVKNPTAAAEPNRKKSKGPKKAAKTATQQPTADIKPSLEYLRNWKASRETWKFNKNHQTILMKRVFHADAIPRATSPPSTSTFKT
ncbi:proteasome subunit alpha type 6 [Colletotrichum tofieldiae]|nr:proteasome subunit alpha type 6 [Colletotrichum tofieldiae]